MVVCVLLPRFELLVALGGRGALVGGPVALAPAPGGPQMIGEVSPTAQARGLHRGMRLGEALSRCPGVLLVPPDPVAVSDGWERLLERLEATGAHVEAAGPGLAFLQAADLRNLHGGALRKRELNAGNAAWWLDGVVGVLRAALGTPARIGAGPTRFCAYAGAMRARSRRAEVIDGERGLVNEPVTLLRERDEVEHVADPLLRMGVETLGAVAAIARAKLSDRFGRAGELAHDLARGLDTPLRPRSPGERLRETLRLPESALGDQLERALGLLIDRLLARHERDGRSLRALVIEARLVEGGTWRERVVLREPLADARRIRLALTPRLAQLPAPAEALRLSVERFGSGAAHATALFEDGSAERRARLRDAVEQARTAAGPSAALRVIEIDPGSRVPERRAMLTPHEL